MQHYFCVHPTIAASNPHKHGRFSRERLGKLMAVSVCGLPAVCSGAAPRQARQTRRRQRLLWIYFLLEGCAAPFSALSPVRSRHLEF